MSIAGKIVASLLALAGVPLTVVAVRQGVAESWFALFGLVLYELLVGAVALVISVAGSTIRRRAEQVANFTDLALGRRVSRYARHYRRYVLEQNARINARDLAHTPSHIPELDAVYVDVGLAPNSPSRKTGGILPGARDDRAERLSIHTLIDRPKAEVYAVIGAPGSGKTTLLRHTASRAAAAKRGKRERRVPVLLALRDHAESLSADSSCSLADLIRDDIGGLAVAEPPGWWEAKLRGGDCLILLDGLDEVARKEDRAAVSEWIERQISKHPRNDFIVTSRPHGYETAVISQATALQVHAFTTGQIRSFVRAWCFETERLATGAAGTEIERRAEEEAADLLDHLNAAPVLQELAVNPLLLTMMVMVHRERRALPAGRADLYHQVCDVMLWRRAESKRMEVVPNGAVRRRILAALAYEMMIAETRDFSRAQALAVFERLLAALEVDIASEALLQSIVESSGLLVEREKDLFSFSHHTIGEYLASVHIRSQGLIDTLVREVDNSWWRETTLLFITDADADPIVEACLHSDTGASLSLAFECLRSHGHVSRSLRDRLDVIRQHAFRNGATSEHRRRIARALAAGHLSKLVTLDNGTLICPDPIPEDLYWLFCQDTGSVLPDGFGGRGPRPGAPARGMWRVEAEAFSTWVSAAAASENSATFRLPVAGEINALRVLSSDRGSSSERLENPWTRTSGHESEAAETSWLMTASVQFHSTTWIGLGHADSAAGRFAAELFLADAIRAARVLSESDHALIGAADLLQRLKEDVEIAMSCLNPRGEALSLAGTLTDIRHLSEPELILERLIAAYERVVLVGLDTSLADPMSTGALIRSLHGSHLASVPSRLFDRMRSYHRNPEAVATAQGADERSVTPSARFAQILCGEAGMNLRYSSPVPRELLFQMLHRACANMDPGPYDWTWTAHVAARLLERSRPILKREEAPTLEEVRAICVSSILLAAANTNRRIQGTAEKFRKVAQGFMELEARITDRVPMETILLVRE